MIEPLPILGSLTISALILLLDPEAGTAFVLLGFVEPRIFAPIPYFPEEFSVELTEGVGVCVYFCFSANLKAVDLAIFLIFWSRSLKHPSRLTFLDINLILLLFL